MGPCPPWSDHRDAVRHAHCKAAASSGMHLHKERRALRAHLPLTPTAAAATRACVRTCSNTCVSTRSSTVSTRAH
jgi:hypothetical protein